MCTSYNGALYPPFGSIWDDEQTWHSFCWVSPVRSGRAVLMLSCPWDPTCPKHCCRHPRKWVLYLPAGCLLNPVLVANPGLAVRPYLLMKSHILTGLGTHDWWNHNSCHLYSNFSWLKLLIVPICWLTPSFCWSLPHLFPMAANHDHPGSASRSRPAHRKYGGFLSPWSTPNSICVFTIKNKHWFFHLNHDSYFKCMYIYICMYNMYV